MKQPVQRARSVEPARRPVPAAVQTVSTPADGALRATLPAWTLAPLRLFLAVTFIYAGIQKLTDPQFFNPHAPGYIGKQIQAFAVGSPLRGLLLGGVLPHATLWGALIACGEIAIGVGALIGLMLRPAAFFGALLSLIFFLSASWRVQPYFYGADIVFLFGWVTLLLAGPLAGAFPTLDASLAPALLRRAPQQRRSQVACALALLLGAPLAASANAIQPQSHPGVERARAPAIRSRAGTRATSRARHPQPAASRRGFIKGVLAGGGVMLVASWFWGVIHPPALGAGGWIGSIGTPSVTGVTPTEASEIAQVQDVPVNTATNFTIPSNGDPGVLIHLESGQFVAFDATCTHAGCPVDYDPSSQMLICPCHGAAFDPARGATVLQGPAPTPLTAIPVNVNHTSGAITLQ